MSATDDRIAAIEAADERDVHRRLQQARAERDEAIAERDRLRAANERLRAFAFGPAPAWEKANSTLKHRVRELEAEIAELRAAR